MKKYANNRLIQIDSYDEFKDLQSPGDWEEQNSIRTSLGIFHHQGVTGYPQFYKYSSPYDYRSMPNYWMISKETFVSLLSEKLVTYKEKIADIEKTISELSV